MPGGLFTSRIGPSCRLPDAAREKSEQSQHDDDDQNDPENAQQGLLWMTVCQRPRPLSGYAEAAVPFSAREPDVQQRELERAPQRADRGVAVLEVKSRAAPGDGPAPREAS